MHNGRYRRHAVCSTTHQALITSALQAAQKEMQHSQDSDPKTCIIFCTIFYYPACTAGATVVLELSEQANHVRAIRIYVVCWLMLHP